ncbi:MAG: efflux RND transporter permease subunit [Lentisphaeria bacterium]|nr:efflux RND transporter permease subunit [Lentisphaeria bacterium]
MISKIFIEHPRLAAVISLVLVLAGLVSINRLPIAEYPEISPPTLYVSCNYAGAGSQVVIDTVGTPLEDEINGVENLLYFSSSADNNGGYFCTVTFQSGTDSDIAMVNLQNAVKRAEPRLPNEVVKEGISVIKRNSDMLGIYAFTTDSPKLSLAELNNFIDANIKDALARIEGVSQIEIWSDKKYAMRVWLDPLRMSGLKISVAEIMDAIDSQNIQAASGNVGSEGSNDYISYKLNVHGRLITPGEFENIVIRRDADNSVIYLKDIARVELGSNTYLGGDLLDGVPVIALGIYRSGDANALATMNRIKEEIARWEQRFPEGVGCELVFDPTEFITISMKEIMVTIVSALVLVILITYLFLQDWRATLIPAVAIPVSLLGTLPFLLLFGFSINVLTMFGLILVIGSLVDDAIVVVENTLAVMEREDIDAKAAAIKSMGQITGAVIATTLVTVACYLPLAFYAGMIGRIYIQFAVSMCVALCLSTVVALTLSPALCGLILRKTPERAPLIFRPFNTILDGSRKIYILSTGILVRRALLTALLTACVFGCIYWIYGKIPSAFLPEEDKGTIMCDIELPRGASQARTFAALSEVQDKLKDVKGIDRILTVAGFSLMSGSGENTAMAVIVLDHWDKRKAPGLSVGAILEEVNQRLSTVAAARITSFTPPAIDIGDSSGVTFNLCGVGDIDIHDFADAAGRFAAALSEDPRVMYAANGFNADTPQLYFDLDRQKAESLGVKTETVFSTLQGKLASYYINDFNLHGKSYYVKIQSDSEFRTSENDILEIQVPNSDGEMVPLRSLGTLKYIVGPNRMTRFNKMISAEMNMQGFPGVTSGELMRLIEGTERPEQYHIEWTGISYQERENEGRIFFLMALAAVFAFLFLVGQYESWSIPVAVMISVIFALFGAWLGLFLAGYPFDIYAQLGMVMLIGLAAKNAILMVEFSKVERERGCSIIEAAMNGANLRYRAVLMTAWSFLLGVLPLVIATGAGAESRKAIGITTFSGMLSATLVGIIFTPALYALCQRIREKAKIVIAKIFNVG